MANLTLGLDLGSQSIGWALADEDGGRIVGMGVRIFPEGVDRDTSGAELSKNESRRVARGMRRQIARRARRRRKLRERLVSVGLLPEVALLPREDSRRDAWESEQFKETNPYVLRRRALTEPLEPFELGRVLLHLNQRRGFLSNRKADRARKKENSDMLKEISALATELNGQTLGHYLANKHTANPHERLRGRHTRREMLLDEFERIWAAQMKYHPELLTPALHDDLRDNIMFFQRKMYWPKSVVGACELEPRLPRCPRADRRAQRFRLLLEVNNLRILDRTVGVERPLTAGEREKLLTYLSGSKERSFDQIRKHLFEEYDGIRFNLETGHRNKLKGQTTDAALAHKSLFGKAWHEVEDWKKNRVVQTIIDGEDAGFEELQRSLELTPELIEKLKDIDLEDGYSSYSLCAIKKLLPCLEAGLPLTSRDAGTHCALRAAGYLLPWEHAVEQKPMLPEPPNVTNPLVRQALHEVRKVVNGILRELVHRPGHRLARIHIELAREIRGTAMQRERLSKEMRERERERDRAAEEIRQAGLQPSRQAIDRYLLWEEQERCCVYSGRVISLVQLLAGEVHEDHILPWPRSLDNSMMNRVVCFRDENDEKRDRTPYEWLAEANPSKYEQVLQRADKLPYPKAKRFRQKSVELDDFFARQFVDTTYITTQVRQYVQCLGADVLCPKGQHTADLRWQWGLNSVLHDDGVGLKKNREDHRHHAVDALVIALTNHSRLQQLAALWRRGGTERTGEILSDPWTHFRTTVEEAVNALHVSHRVQRKVSGALHEETIYGPTENAGEFVYRKPLEVLTPGMVGDIRDPVVRASVQQRLAEFGISADARKIPAQVWAKPLLMPCSNPAMKIPIKKVRIIRREQTIRPIRGGTACVKPGSIHHICLFEWKNAAGKLKRDMVPVSMLEAMERVKVKQSIICKTHPEKPEAGFLMSLSAGEMVLLTHGGREDLYRFETAASTSKQMWFRHHAAGGKSSDKRGVVSKMPGTLQARKVTVDPIGRIRWAND